MKSQHGPGKRVNRDKDEDEKVRESIKQPSPEKQPEEHRRRTVTNQDAQKQITNADEGGSLNEKEVEGE